MFFAYKVLSICLLCYELLRFLGAHRAIERRMLWKLISFVIISLLLSIAFPGYLFLRAIPWLADLIGERKNHSTYLSEEPDSPWTEVACILGASTGFILCMFRALSHLYLKWKRGKRTESLLSAPDSAVLQADDLVSNPDNMTSLFRSMFNEYVLTTLLSLSILFKQKLSSDDRLLPPNITESTHRLTHLDVEPGPGSFLKDAQLWFNVTLSEHLPGLYHEVRSFSGLRGLDFAQ